MSLSSLRRALKDGADPARAVVSAGFFKTGPGQYGEGDTFLGISVAALRTVMRAHRDLVQHDRLALRRSPWHEERLLALTLLTDAHDRAAMRSALGLKDCVRALNTFARLGPASDRHRHALVVSAGLGFTK